MSYEVFSDEMKKARARAHFTATLIKLENSVLAFFDEKGSMKLGTLTVALPKLSGQTYISSVLLGDRNIVITKILAGCFSNAFNCIALISTHLTDIKESEGPLLLKLAQRLIDKAS